jgi:ribosomal protein S18 acetylase RimI-like enzyme
VWDRLVMGIAPLASEYIDDAVALWHEAGLTRPWNDPREDLCRALRGPTSTILGLLEGGTLLATAMVGHDGHRGWVYYLAVAPAARHQGRGRAMMDACEAWLLERGVPKLNLMMRGENTAARGFYAALGYTNDDVVVFSRRLD